MQVLVTGGTGFSGKALCLRLVGLGHQVTALDIKEGLRTDELRDAGVRVVRGSVTDRELVARCMDDVEVVVHLAAAFRELNVPESSYDEVNVGGTRIVLEEALRCGVRKVVHWSTCGVHGNVEDPPADEESRKGFADYYQGTKWRAESVVREVAEKGLTTVIIRPTAIYGPGDPGRFRMIFRQVEMGIFPMFGSGDTLYHPVFIENLLDACCQAMEPAFGDGEAILIGDESYLSIERLVRMVAEALGRNVRIPHFPVWPAVAAGHVCQALCRPIGVAPPIFPRRVDWYRQNRAFRIDKAKRALGYVPRVGLAEGLRRTGEWYRDQGYLA